MAIAMVVGNVIGTGIFMKPGQAAEAAGSLEIVMAAWIVGGLSCVLGALCFAELALMYPQAGGLYVYLRTAYGKPVAFLFGWSEFVFGRPASIGAYSIGLVSQLTLIHEHLFRTNDPGSLTLSLWQTILIAMIAIGTIALINARGVLWGGRVQGLTTWVKCLFLILLAALPVLLMAEGHIGLTSENFQSTLEVTQTTFASKFAVTLLAVLWAYNGWHGICPIAEEVRDPRRNILIALGVGMGLILFLYGIVNISYHGSMTMAEIHAAGFALPQKMVEKLLNPVSPDLASMASLVITISIAVSFVGGINVNLMNGPRVAFAVGRDIPALGRLGRAHDRFHTPAAGIAFQAIMSVACLLSVAGYIAWQGIERGEQQFVFYTLTDYVVYSAGFFYLLTVGAVIVLRRTQPETERPFRTPLSPWLPLAYLLFNSWFLWEVFRADWIKASASLVLSLAGLPVYDWLTQIVVPRDGDREPD
jgi:basic amino acid/polyamine antiporter, APA family